MEERIIHVINIYVSFMYTLTDDTVLDHILKTIQALLDLLGMLERLNIEKLL